MKITTKKIEELIKKVEDIEKEIKDFFEIVQVEYNRNPSGVIGFSEYHWVQPKEKILEVQIKSLELYEEWYSSIQPIVSRLHPDRNADLNDMYEKNKEILELKKTIWSSDKEKFQNNFLINLSKQKSILSSTKEFVSEGEIDTEIMSSGEQNSTNLEQNMYINLMSQIAILSNQFSRYESDIRDLSQKIDSIGRITITNINQNMAKTGEINITHEYLVKGMKQELDEELKDLDSKVKAIGDGEQKTIIKDLIKDVLDEKNPKVEWLKDKLSKLKYWGSKAGLAIIKLKVFTDILGIS